MDLLADGGAWMMPVRRDHEEYTLLGVLNFEADAWDSVTLTFDWPAAPGETRFSLLDRTGTLVPAVPAEVGRDGPNLRARFDVPVAALDAVVFRVEK